MYKKTVDDIETALTRRSETDQEMLLWAVRARAILTHQTATPAVVDNAGTADTVAPRRTLT
jgi:hypothetical protein